MIVLVIALVLPNRFIARELPITAVFSFRLLPKNWPVFKGRERIFARSGEVATTVAEMTDISPEVRVASLEAIGATAEMLSSFEIVSISEISRLDLRY